jgi:DNA polymerase mu
MRKFILVSHGKLQQKNYMVDLSSFHTHNALRTSHWDSLEKALTIFILPLDGIRPRVHRRLDLIFAAPETYWTAVVGWYAFMWCIPLSPDLCAQDRLHDV